ncbi:MAG: hypothetical protein ABL860_01940 [Candidatus Nitrotoga sp.]
MATLFEESVLLGHYNSIPLVPAKQPDRAINARDVAKIVVACQIKS